MTANGSTLQITLAPSDWRHAQFVLPHQVKTWRAQFSEILITVDLHRSAGRFSADWESGRDKVLALVGSVEGARVEVIDYGESAQSRVSREFFGGSPVPAKDFRGGPYYSYFFSLNASTHDAVLHVDSDILFGGGSQAWLSEALALMEARPEVLVSAPHPGPPAADGRLRHLFSKRLTDIPNAHLLPEMSTRVFLIDRRRFRERVGALVPRGPSSARLWVKALIEGNPPADLPEHIFTREMDARGLSRIDFLGSGPGMWSLHPPYRCRDFYDKLPSLISMVESGDVPDAQRGDHDLNSSMVDWSEAENALARNRWWRRIWSRRNR